MRDILFKGRRSYNQEWVSGSLVIDDRGDSHIIPFADLEECGHHLRIDGDKPMFFDQETIGQFTGLTDKNGVKIFFNSEIVKFKLKKEKLNLHDKDEFIELEGFLLYDDSELRVEIELLPKYEKDGYVALWYDCLMMSDFEVIGSIHEK